MDSTSRHIPTRIGDELVCSCAWSTIVDGDQDSAAARHALHRAEELTPVLFEPA